MRVIVYTKPDGEIHSIIPLSELEHTIVDESDRLTQHEVDLSDDLMNGTDTEKVTQEAKKYLKGDNV